MPLSDLEDFKQSLRNFLYPKATDRISKALCIDCGQPAVPNCTTEAGIKEYTISGLCEKCYNKIFEYMED